MNTATALLDDAGFDIVHPFDAHGVAHELGLAMLADPARRCGLLVGNTRALWPRIVERFRARPTPHPFEEYVEETCAKIEDARCWFAHRRYDGGAFLPFQRIAVASGLGTLAPTQLVIHPEYGPWFALRAIVLVAGEPTTRRLPIACTCGTACMDALSRAQAASGPDAWRAWLAVRDSCTIGRNFRYSDDQIVYHYTKDRSRLR